MSEAPSASPHGSTDSPSEGGLDLAAIATDLADVEVALHRLESGTYFTDEVTGEPLAADWLASHPTARSRPTA